MEEVAIKVDKVSKVFKLPHEKNSSLKSVAVNFYKREKGYELQRALEDVSLEIKKGEFFGILGRNGSGKSTLLKLLAGIYTPTNGTVQINGTLTPFIELGVGFNPELTGRENVYLNGALLGFNRKEMSKMYKDIVEFAGLKKFMDQKLKNYSSGMQVRLAFSIAIRAESDILLIDEVLAVGDAAFQAKSFDVFRNLKKAGKTIVFVSHDLESVKDFCSSTVVLDKGSLVFAGSSEDAANYYLTKVAAEEQQAKDPYSMEQLASRITNKVKISHGRLENEKGREINILKNEPFQVKYDLEFHEDASDPNPGLIILDQFGLQVASANATWANIKTGNFKKGDKVTVSFKFPNILESGHYKVIANVFYNDSEQIYGWENRLMNIYCEKTFSTGSVVSAPYSFSIIKARKNN